MLRVGRSPVKGYLPVENLSCSETATRSPGLAWSLGDTGSSTGGKPEDPVLPPPLPDDQLVPRADLPGLIGALHAYIVNVNPPLEDQTAHLAGRARQVRGADDVVRTEDPGSSQPLRKLDHRRLRRPLAALELPHEAR